MVRKQLLNVGNDFGSISISFVKHILVRSLVLIQWSFYTEISQIHVHYSQDEETVTILRQYASLLFSGHGVDWS